MPTNIARLHPLHRAWQMLPARSRRLWLARGGAWLAPGAGAHPPDRCGGVVIAGEIGQSSGLGEGARILSTAMRRLGVETVALAAGPGQGNGRAPGADRDVSRWPADAALMLHVNAPVLPAALLELGRGLAKGRKIIGFWNWELPTVPAHWRPALRLVHEVWCASAFTAQALRTISSRPVRVVRYPLALSPPVPSALDRQAFGLAPDVVVVLCAFSLASSFERKNPLGAIAAFKAAFGDRTDRLLLLKVGHTEHYPADLARIRAAIAGAANIRLETRTLPHADMHALTQACDMVLSLHRSEGFGLVPAQAMLLGRPVVATNWSATAEFLDESCGAPIGYRLIPARDPRGVFEAPGAVWADADVADAARALRALADDPGRRQAMGHAARLAGQIRFGADGLQAALSAIGVESGSGMAA